MANIDQKQKDSLTVNPYADVENKLNFNSRLAIFITSAMGSMIAVYIILVIILSWISWEVFSHHPDDPYPFTFLLLIINVTQIILMPLIMVGQNLLNRRDEVRADEAYKATMANYHHIEDVLTRLTFQEQQSLNQAHMLHHLFEHSSCSQKETGECEIKQQLLKEFHAK